MSSTVMSCRVLRGSTELRRRLWSSVHPLHRTFAQSTKPSRRPVARSTLRRSSSSPTPSPSSFSSPPPRSSAPSASDEHRESSSRPVRQPVAVSVNSLAASRRAAFNPQSQSDLSDDTTLTPAENAAAILDILAALDRALPLRQLERLIDTLLALASSSRIPPLTQQQYLTTLRALTRRPITVGRHLPHYTKLAASIPPASSPYHPAYNDAQLMARLRTDGDRLRMRRAFVVLAFGIRVDMAVQLLAMVQPSQSLPVQVLRLAERALELAGHRYMAARVRKALAKAEASGGFVTLPEMSELPSDVRRTFPQLLASSDATRAMTASQTQRLAAELEQLSAGQLGEDTHLQLLLASVRIGQQLTADEVEQLSDMLPLASQKLEINRESQEDSIVRWRVMDLAAAIMEHMKQQRTQPTQLIHDELFRVYANCAAIQPALDLLATLRSTDTLHYRYLLRTASLLQRWEHPHTIARNLLASLPHTTQQPPDASLYNDVLRACDRAEQWELLFRTIAEMRAAGVAGNEVTWQYVAGAGVQCGEEGRGVVEVVGRDDAGRAEWRREVEAEMAVVEQMGVQDFVGGGNVEGGGVVKEEDVEEEVRSELRLVKEKLKAELAEEIKLVDDDQQTLAATSTTGTAHDESERRSI